MLHNEDGEPVFNEDAVVACHVTGTWPMDDSHTVFGPTVEIVVEFTFEDIHGNEQVELQAVEVTVPTLKEVE